MGVRCMKYGHVKPQARIMYVLRVYPHANAYVHRSAHFHATYDVL